MMLIKNKLNDLKTDYIRNRDNRLNSIRNILTRITVAEKNNSNNELSDEDIIKLFISLEKELNKNIGLYQESNRQDLADKDLLELEIILGFLPKKLTESQLKSIIDTIKLNNSDDTKPLIGIVMKELNSKYKGQFDQKLVTNLIS
jgi:uncharacterized protein YqeY